MVGCSWCTCPSIHFFVSRSRSVVRGAVVCVWCVLCSVLCWCWFLVVVVLCVVCCVVCCVGVGVWWWCCVGVMWWCGCGVVWGGVHVCVFCVVFSLISLDSLLFLSYSLSLFPSLLFPSSLFFPLFSFLFLVFSSLPFTPPNTVERTDFEAFECDLAHGRCTAVGSLPFSSSLPPPQKKKVGNFLLQEYFRRGIYFLLQFKINSEKSPPGEIADITVLY